MFNIKKILTLKLIKQKNEVVESLKFAELDHNYAGSITTCTEIRVRVNVVHEYAQGSGLKKHGMISDFRAALDDFTDTPQELIARNANKTIMHNDDETDWYARQRSAMKNCLKTLAAPMLKIGHQRILHNSMQVSIGTYYQKNITVIYCHY